MSNLIHLIYNSAATHTFSDDELETLLHGARNTNASLNITGMLLYIDGCFFQVLEGPQDMVDMLAEKISRDPRHRRMTTIIREPIVQRAFSEWTMGFSRMTAQDASGIEGLNDFFNEGRVLTEIDTGRSKKLLQAFKQGRWRVKFTSSANPSPAPARQPAPRLPEQSRPAFTFAYQPIVDVKGAVTGYEALVRGHANEPSYDVLQHVALTEVAHFEADGHRRAIGLAQRLGLTCALHLNVMLHVQINERKLVDSTLATAALCKMAPSDIVLEIKHEATVGDPAIVASWLGECRKRGLRVSIDDFGSGYSGLALLDRFQPDLISLSMWLVRQLDSNGPRQAIVRGLIQTCSDLGIDIVAKGVETADEFTWLRDEGVALFQGFLFAQPGFESLPTPKWPVESA